MGPHPAPTPIVVNNPPRQGTHDAEAGPSGADPSGGGPRVDESVPLDTQETEDEDTDTGIDLSGARVEQFMEDFQYRVRDLSAPSGYTIPVGLHASTVRPMQPPMTTTPSAALRSGGSTSTLPRSSQSSEILPLTQPAGRGHRAGGAQRRGESSIHASDSLDTSTPSAPPPPRPSAPPALRPRDRPTVQPSPRVAEGEDVGGTTRGTRSQVAPGRTRKLHQRPRGR